MKSLFFVLFLSLQLGVLAQKPEKKVLSPDDFARWKTIRGTTISNNGKIVAYELKPQRGDGNLIIKHPDSKQEDTIPRGFAASFSPESDFVIFKIKQPLDSIRKAKINNTEEEEIPGDSLGIFVFKNKKVIKYPDLKSYSIPEKNAHWIAFLTKKTQEGANEESDEEQKNKEPGTLVLFQVKTNDTIQYQNVSEYYFSKYGQSIAFIQQTGDSLKQTKVFVFDTASKNTKMVFSDKGCSKQAVTDDDGKLYAFLFSKDTTEEKNYSLFYGSQEDGIMGLPVDSSTKGMPIGWLPSEHRKLFFSADGSRLFFGTANKKEVEPKDTLTKEEKVNVDIWNWKDVELQSQQKINLEKEKKRTYLAVLHLDNNKFVQLGDPIIRDVNITLKGNGQYALGKDIMPYRRSSSWTGEEKANYYLVDIKNGIKRLFVKGIENAWISPGGSFIVWYNPADSSYYSRSTNIESQSVNQLTKHIPVNFCDERNNTPSNPRPYGIAGWSENDRYIYLYDRFDIWRIDLTAMRVPVNVTRSFGRRNKLRLRYIKLDKDEEFIDAENKNIVSSFDERSKAAGFFSVEFKNYKEPRLLIAEDNYFGTPLKAKDEDKIVFTKESFSEFPDLWISDLRFDKPRKISEANPQQKEYNWAFSNLIKWTSFNGDPLEGIMYLPENFNPRQKYPLIVYYYERNSDNLFRHYIPSPSRSVINRTFYASNGYIVFVPDIEYKIGYPGQSAYNAVVSGVSFLTNNFTFIDPGKIGIQGQSWGGYQTAYIVTQTNMFAAAMAGAPVSNMTSAYGGIRWGSGMSRMFQYEHTQSRIGGSLWEKPLLYIENSPLFHAPKVNTPLLMMHNDNDGAVPWYQGIEFFVALRRLDKPVWMLNYNDEPHNLKAESWGNRMDLSIRMKGFFDHYLKKEPMPVWMKYGIPAKDKNKKRGY